MRGPQAGKMSPGRGILAACTRHAEQISAARRRRRIRQIKGHGLRTGSLTAIKNEGDDRQNDHDAAKNETGKTRSTAVVRHDATPMPSERKRSPRPAVPLAGF